MPTVIFDADSTIFSIETLDYLSVSVLKNDPKKISQINQLTDMGMRGEIGFEQSFAKRLEILKLPKQIIEPFASNLMQYVTDGFADLISWLKSKEINGQPIDLWVLSGGLSDVIKPVLVDLGFMDSKIHGSGILWDDAGVYSGLSPGHPLNQSKVNAIKQQSWDKQWGHPSIVVGDGYTDLQIYQNNMVDHFIAYTQHAKRDIVIDSAPYQAHNIDKLKQTLDLLLV